MLMGVAERAWDRRCVVDLRHHRGNIHHKLACRHADLLVAVGKPFTPTAPRVTHHPAI